MIDARNENETSSDKRLNVIFNLKKQKKNNAGKRIRKRWGKKKVCMLSLDLSSKMPDLAGAGRA